jgi:hypothetical protein
LDAFVDLEFWVALEIFPYRRLGVVSWPSGGVPIAFRGELIDDRIEDNAITSHGCQRRVDLQLCKHMVVCVVGIQADNHPSFATSKRLDLIDNILRNTRPLNNRNALEE